jgi:hypothetical protein
MPAPTHGCGPAFWKSFARSVVSRFLSFNIFLLTSGDASASRQTIHSLCAHLAFVIAGHVIHHVALLRQRYVGLAKRSSHHEVAR